MRFPMLVLTALTFSSTAWAAPCTYAGSVPTYVRCVADQAWEALELATLNQDRIESSTHYWEANSLNNISSTADNSWDRHSDYLTFIKNDNDTDITIDMNTNVLGGTFSGARGVKFEVRVDGNAPLWGNMGTISASDAEDFITVKGLFRGLAAGPHTVSVWTTTGSVGTSSGVVLDPGGWGGAILVKESY